MIPKTFHVLFILGLFSKTSCYFIFIQKSVTWSTAQLFCREHHIDLATVQSDQDRYKIQEISAADDFQSRAWVGLYDGVPDWLWSYQDQKLVYSNWDSLEETSSRTQSACGVFRNTGKWHVASCEEQKPFFCYQGNTILGKFNFNSIHLNWRSAQEYCRNKHIDLAFISNSGDNGALVFQLNVHFQSEGWIGLSKNLWQWSDQSQVTWLSLKWADWQPDNASGNEKCGFVDPTGLIGDDGCSYQYTLPFFCSKRAKIQIVRFELSSAGLLNQSAVMEAIEKEMKLIFSDQTDPGSRVTWRVQIFQKKPHSAQQHINTCEQ